MKPTPPPPPPPPPYDAEIEYIESNGQQFINTGIHVEKYPFKVELRALVKSGTRSENDFFGNYYVNDRKCIVCGYYNGTIHLWTGSRWQPQRIDFGQWYDISISLPSNQAADMVINENEYRTAIVSNITESRSTICLFCDGENNASYLIGRIASFKMTVGNSVVLDMIPVRIGTTGYMYDKLSGQIFGNAGSGSFSIGPDID